MTTPAEYLKQFLTTGEQHTADFQKRMDAHRAKADQIREHATAAIARITERKDLTPEAKRTAAARIYKPAADRVQQLLDEHIDMVKQHKQTLAKKAFGADNATDPASTRQARALAAGLQDADSAERLLREAQFDGDHTLARVIAATAFERGWHDVVDVWNADGKHNNEMRHAVELLQMPDTSDPAWRMNTAMAYTTPRPGVLEGLKPHEISRAADADLEVA
ncbi:hypothetical protein ACIBL5_00485 [Streptomyces sp. NPDC050516]|uniref:hypothetical protein n=1 Tax=Streptomyces sp. NPDC050516 TaxID=3365621 RepID=UPI0037B32398